MPRALSIHIGVNHASAKAHLPLRQTEDVAWRMAQLAQRAGYDSMLVLRGETATRQAVHTALTAAAGMLAPGDTLLVTFCGHGTRMHAVEDKERDGMDEGWCLSDGVLLDNRLAGYWRLFEKGVCIVVVSESCYSGGMDRDDEDWEPGWQNPAPGWGNYRGEPSAIGLVRPCIAEPPKETLGILATVLLLTASRKDQVAREGLYSEKLLATWNDGAFEGSYCDLHHKVRTQVMADCEQEPQIIMVGSGDPAFCLKRAFYVDRDPWHGGGGGYRDAWDGRGVGDGYRG